MTIPTIHSVNCVFVSRLTKTKILPKNPQSPQFAAASARIQRQQSQTDTASPATQQCAKNYCTVALFHLQDDGPFFVWYVVGSFFSISECLVSLPKI